MKIPGPVAQDKDWARDARQKRIMPVLRKSGDVRLDFSEVTVTTQSFIHALIAEPLQLLGAEALERLDFFRCVEQVKETVKTVVAYSVRAREIAQSVLPNRKDVRTVDAPQADDLRKVRATIATLIDGPLPMEAVAEDAGYSLRHAHYRMNAARVLGLVRIASRIAMLTESGHALLATREDSTQEHDHWLLCISRSPIMKKLAPDLIGPREPDVTAIATRMERLAKLSPNTARRRARSLLAWRRYLASSQLDLALPSGRRGGSTAQ